jgi:L-fuculose-phosphate aldolase
MRPPERRLRRDLIQFGRLCYERHLLVGLDGNLSVRLLDDLVLCTRAGCHKGLLTDEDLLVVDLNGRKVRGRGTPTSELAMHLACYQSRPDIEAVVHAHPPTCIAFTIAGVSMARCTLPEVVLTLGTIPTLDYETTGTGPLATLVGNAVQHNDAVMMDRHGAVCVGPSVQDAFCKLETMEHMAKIMRDARSLGGIQDLPPEEAVHLRRMGLKRYGGPPSVVALADTPDAGLPPVCTSCSGCGNPTPEGLAPAAGFTIARLTNTSPQQR